MERSPDVAANNSVGPLHFALFSHALFLALVAAQHLPSTSSWLQVALYTAAGFALVGPSNVVHGQDPWMEMSLEFEAE